MSDDTIAKSPVASLYLSLPDTDDIDFSKWEIILDGTICRRA